MMGMVSEGGGQGGGAKVAKPKAEKKTPRSGRSGLPARQFADLPGLVPHRIVADKLGVTPDALRDWVCKGTFPEPHSVIERTWLYPVDLIRSFLDTGTWPAGTKFRRPR